MKMNALCHIFLNCISRSLPSEHPRSSSRARPRTTRPHLTTSLVNYSSHATRRHTRPALPTANAHLPFASFIPIFTHTRLHCLCAPCPSAFTILRLTITSKSNVSRLMSIEGRWSVARSNTVGALPHVCRTPWSDIS